MFIIDYVTIGWICYHWSCHHWVDIFIIDYYHHWIMDMFIIDYVTTGWICLLLTMSPLGGYVYYWLLSPLDEYVYYWLLSPLDGYVYYWLLSPLNGYVYYWLLSPLNGYVYYWLCHHWVDMFIIDYVTTEWACILSLSMWQLGECVIIKCVITWCIMLSLSDHWVDLFLFTMHVTIKHSHPVNIYSCNDRILQSWINDLLPRLILYHS